MVYFFFNFDIAMALPKTSRIFPTMKLCRGYLSINLNRMVTYKMRKCGIFVWDFSCDLEKSLKIKYSYLDSVFDMHKIFALKEEKKIVMTCFVSNIYSEVFFLCIVEMYEKRPLSQNNSAVECKFLISQFTVKF